MATLRLFGIVFLINISLARFKELLADSNQITLDEFLKKSLQSFKKRDGSYKKGPDGIEYFLAKNLTYRAQFDNDIVMIYKTLFPETQLANELSQVDEFKKELPKNSEIINSLKTILFTIAEVGLYYSYEPNLILNLRNPKKEFLWPYPLAASICHGGRIIFLIENSKVNPRKFEEFFFGNNSKLLTNRSTASHIVTVDKSYIFEKKIILEAALDWLKSKFNKHYSPHHYMNIPIGGIGNYWPDGYATIGNHGFGFDLKNNKTERLQHGHLYVRTDTFKNYNYSSLLIGLEEEAPEYRGMYSKKAHDFLNAFDKPDISVCGGKKWSDLEPVLGTRIPNNYGGKAVFVNNNIDTNILNKINNYEEELQKQIWWIILSSNAIQYHEFKEKYLNIDQMILKEMMSSIIKDQ